MLISLTNQLIRVGNFRCCRCKCATFGLLYRSVTSMMIAVMNVMAKFEFGAIGTCSQTRITLIAVTDTAALLVRKQMRILIVLATAKHIYYSQMLWM